MHAHFTFLVGCQQFIWTMAFLIDSTFVCRLESGIFSIGIYARNTSTFLNLY